MGNELIVKSTNIPPLIKWTGSKRRQASKIYPLFPNFSTYFEPFLGGGALLYLVYPRKAIVGDIYKPLINFWKIVKDNASQVVEKYTENWELLQQNIPDYYYKVRDRFNQEPNAFDLCFLTRTCVNGIVRFNKDGKFNNSFHLSRRGMHPSRFCKVAMNWQRRIQNVEFKCFDYEITLEHVQKGDFVYFDPPYAGSRNRYTSNLDLKRFYHTLEKLNAKGIKWALSFDGRRGETDMRKPIPDTLYKCHFFIEVGNSPVKNVLSGSLNKVQESLYLNYLRE